MTATNESYQYIECGLTNVYLVNGYRFVDSPTGRQVIITEIDGLHEAIGRLLLHEKKDLSGDEIRFLRHEMLMSQVVLARLLDVSEQAINRWERGKNSIPKPAESLIRLLYAEHIKEDTSEIQKILRRIADLEEGLDDELMLQETDQEWKLAA